MLNEDQRTSSPRAELVREASYEQLKDYAPNVAVLPWGATESHGGHLPYATDVIEAEAFANRAGGDIRYSWRSRG